MKRMLETTGYQYVIRSAASHTPIDLLAPNDSETLAVQVKGGSNGRISGEEWRELVEWASVFKAEPVLAKKRRARWGVVKVESLSLGDMHGLGFLECCS